MTGTANAAPEVAVLFHWNWGGWVKDISNVNKQTNLGSRINQQHQQHRQKEPWDQVVPKVPR